MLAALFLALTVVSASPALADLATEQQCVAEAIYHEAKNEPELGRALVYHSVMNRAKDRRWRSSPCGVIWQPYQYSFTLWSPEKMQRHINSDLQKYNQIHSQVLQLWGTEEPEGFEGVNHYLRCDIRHKVSWEDNMEFLGQVGAHCFYRGY